MRLKKNIGLICYHNLVLKLLNCDVQVIKLIRGVLLGEEDGVKFGGDTLMKVFKEHIGVSQVCRKELIHRLYGLKVVLNPL